MKDKNNFIYPYIPNSLPEFKQSMMREIGINEVDELYQDIPKELRFKGKMNLPKPLHSEMDLKRHMEEILSKNRTCEENVSFLGAGCWRHYVPAICDEINSRAEFLTAYAGEPYEDHGRFQALFEYESMMAELVDMDVVNVPTYDGAQAAATSLRMASRITGRKEVLIAGAIHPERLLVIKNYLNPDIKVISVNYDKASGQVDLEDLKQKVSSKTAAIYFENPTYFGCIECQGEDISQVAHEEGALMVTFVDPISLGVIAPPSHYGADIVCGDIQPLGIHMNYGGGCGGFIATRDEEKFVMEYPSRLFGITRTVVEGEWGFGDVAYERTSFAKREEGKEFVGTAAALWGITAGVYLALMGPQGMKDIGKTIMQKAQYAARKLSAINGVKAPLHDAPYFKEFVVDFNATGITVEEVNNALLKEGIFGGKDLSREFPSLGQSALYCITEVHSKNDIDHLVETLN
ncbi:MAG TPA: aminomethyl-transferring glycine dehydrogenase subunit GcvPA, partial [Acetomicrobium flavidum]|uniref:aminomethyl-transferring glycine dehydrogenase subunit GcvPA n=1 Tax=Acetomicrobium flavidum TaxID=49896 RepID=UPI002BBAD9DF|nr:aminomethyl-transferring glycine dehydrogenase subunit GcvPA [Acetomicrobium flavidum]